MTNSGYIISYDLSIGDKVAHFTKLIVFTHIS